MAPTIVNLALRGLEFVWALLVLALTGNMIALALGGNPSTVNFCMFVGVFAMLSLIYLVPTTVREGLGVPIVTIVLDSLNTAFFLIGGIALAVRLGVHRCTNDDYTRSNYITAGAADTQKRCTEAQAVCAFLWFGFAAFAASTLFSFLQSRGSVNLRGVGAGGIRRGGPSMSQV